jgi:uncharacterized protein HemX
MDTGVIIAIVVVALLLIALFAFALPRMRGKKAERELAQRREHVAGQHREVAGEAEREAEVAEQRARMAQTEAERQRAEAQLHQQQAEMHERGMADETLVRDDERDKFEAGGGPRFQRDDSGDRPAAEAAEQRPPYRS